MSSPAALVEYHPACLEHEAGPYHPERPERLTAIVDGIKAAGMGDAIDWVEPRQATIDELAVVHERGYVEAIRRFCERGGGMVSMDTGAGPGSWDAALFAAGAGLDAVEKGKAAFCNVRPCGHHAFPGEGRGFCLFNNIAVVAARLAAQGEKVLIFDWDVHHGDGTQAMFYEDDRVLYASVHQSPLYPFTGHVEERGKGKGEGYNVNVPVPPGATGDVFLAALDAVADIAEDRFGGQPDRVLVSAGFDSHRNDILEDTALSLTSADYGALTRRCMEIAPPDRCVLLLEGGYDEGALAASAAACVAVLAGRDDHEPPEEASAGGPGMDVVEAAIRAHR